MTQAVRAHSASFAWSIRFKSAGGRDIVSSSLEEESVVFLVTVGSGVVPFMCPVRLSCSLRALGRLALCWTKILKVRRILCSALLFANRVEHAHPSWPTVRISELDLHYPASAPHTKPVVMATHARKGGTSLLDVRIDLLNKNASEPSPARQIFRTVSAILALVRVSTLVQRSSVSSQRWPNQDKMIKNKDSVDLSEDCFNMCEVLKTVIHGKDADDLSEPVMTALEDLGRCVDLALVLSTPTSNPRVIRETERVLRRGASMPVIEYNKGKIEGYKLEVQGILITLGAPRSLLDENLPIDECAPLLAPVDLHSHDTTTTSASEGTLESRLCHLVQNTDYSLFLSLSSTTMPQPVDV